ncbi:hypothetical protein [Anaerobium acetethylicum]|uniref:hypothetical protein n=1 Tax=Anaerobium acetethylicum TaxID=1619234 RepID=UPI001A9A5E10|nr:hypothetical protein [Anaerobium acetethylicum]
MQDQMVEYTGLAGKQATLQSGQTCIYELKSLAVTNVISYHKRKYQQNTTAEL